MAMKVFIMEDNGYKLENIVGQRSKVNTPSPLDSRL